MTQRTIRQRVTPLGILDRYVLRYFMSSYAICVILTLSLYVLADLFTKLHRFLRRSGDDALMVIVRHYLSHLPLIFYNLSPYLCLMAAMFAITRLNKNNELIPMLSAGVGLGRVLAPIFAATLVICGVVVGIQELVLPSLANEIREGAAFSDEPGVSVPIIGEHDRQLVIRRYHPAEQRMEQLVLYRFRAGQPGVEQSTLIADEARWDGSAWQVTGGELREFDEAGQPLMDPATGDYRVDRFDGPLPVDIKPLDLEVASRQNMPLSFRDLQIQHQRAPDPALRVAMHNHVVFPLTNLLLVLMGLPFVLKGRRQSIFLGLFLCLLICSGYFAITFLLRVAATEGSIPAAAGVWMPVGLILCVSALLYNQIED